MDEVSRSGRGAALYKVLEQPLRRPGQHQATEQSTVETSSSVTQPTQQTSMSGVVKPMGRGILMSTTPIAPPSKPELAAGQTTPMSSLAFQKETPSPLGRGFLLKPNAENTFNNSFNNPALYHNEHSSSSNSLTYYWCDHTHNDDTPNVWYVPIEYRTEGPIKN